MRETLEKIKQYQRKYNLDDSEMQSVINLIMMKHGLMETDTSTSYNEMSKALGFTPASYNLGGELSVPKDQQQYVDAIKNLASLAKELHNQVTLQSLIFQPDVSTFTTSFERTKVNVFSFVHPVVAALFIPKFNVIDQHMIFASIAEIVSLKSDGLQLQTQPQYELYWNIATDPSETTCVNKVKPFSDLATRVNVQHKLWESVLNLRQGKFYIDNLSTFIMAIDSCKASVFDAADLAYVKDEGTILRKLFSAFSFRPIIVQTQPMNPLQTSLTGVMNNIPVLNSLQTTTIPMIPLRLPLNITGGKLGADAGADPVVLKDALTQQQVYIQSKQIVVKNQTVLFAREILVFYVHRRFQQVDINRLRSPYSLIQLPNTLSQFEKLNDTQVQVPTDVTLSDKAFNLKSCVYVQSKNMNGSEVIYGCGAVVMDVNNDGTDTTDDNVIYEPLKLDEKDDNLQPCQQIGADLTEVMDMVSKKGTLYIYKNDVADEC